MSLGAAIHKAGSLIISFAVYFNMETSTIQVQLMKLKQWYEMMKGVDGAIYINAVVVVLLQCYQSVTCLM